MSLLDATGKSQKEQYLDILALVLYIFAGLGVLTTFGIVGVVFFATTIPLLVQPAEAVAPLAFVGTMMGCISVFVVTLSLLSCGLQAGAAYCLQTRKGYVLILIVAGLMLLSVPVGTVTGVLILILLSDPEIKALFGIATVPPVPAQEPEPPA